METLAGQDRFLYNDDGFQVVLPNSIDETTPSILYSRALLPELRPHVIPGPRLTRGGHIALRQPEVPKDEPYTYFLAQLIHYGLPFEWSKDAAKLSLAQAIHTGTLKVPGKLAKLEWRLKKLWSETPRDVIYVDSDDEESEQGTEVTDEDEDGVVDISDDEVEEEAEKSEEKSSTDEEGEEDDENEEEESAQQADLVTAFAVDSQAATDNDSEHEQALEIEHGIEEDSDDDIDSNENENTGSQASSPYMEIENQLRANAEDGAEEEDEDSVSEVSISDDQPSANGQKDEEKEAEALATGVDYSNHDHDGVHGEHPEDHSDRMAVIPISSEEDSETNDAEHPSELTPQPAPSPAKPGISTFHTGSSDTRRALPVQLPSRPLARKPQTNPLLIPGESPRILGIKRKYVPPKTPLDNVTIPIHLSPVTAPAPIASKPITKDGSRRHSKRQKSSPSNSPSGQLTASMEETFNDSIDQSQQTYGPKVTPSWTPLQGTDTTTLRPTKSLQEEPESHPKPNIPSHLRLNQRIIGLSNPSKKSNPKSKPSSTIPISNSRPKQIPIQAYEYPAPFTSGKTVRQLKGVMIPKRKSAMGSSRMSFPNLDSDSEISDG